MDLYKQFNEMRFKSEDDSLEDILKTEDSTEQKETKESVPEVKEDSVSEEAEKSNKY